MKIELKTGDTYSSKPLFSVFFTSLIILVIVLISNISLKLSNISKHYEINYLCKLLKIEKSPINFKKVSKFTKLNNKQKVWEFCREVLNY